ncbi:MAG TPA: SMC-Scp complex subunit ScpB [Clostridiales bacterium]|jgi:segregation and condensation protein B|nr:SMC-Scp complex subunit ScpB [Clostridiales bacterium]
MDLRELEAAIEGILFASGEPVPINRIADVLGLDGKLVSDAADRLADTYVLERRGIRLIRLENSIQLCSAPELAELIRRVLETRKPPQLSQTALEVLAIVAYFQPVTRAFVEKMRGVDSSYTVSSLEEKGLIEPCGKLKVPGRPTVYRTTPDFLRCFGLKSINDLPKLPDSGISEGQLELQNAISALIEQEETQCSGPAS